MIIKLYEKYALRGSEKNTKIILEFHIFIITRAAASPLFQSNRNDDGNERKNQHQLQSWCQMGNESYKNNETWHNLNSFLLESSLSENIFYFGFNQTLTENGEKIH